MYIYLSEKIQISNLNVHTRMAFIDQINQNVGFFIYYQDFLFIRGIIGSPKANNTFQIIPGDLTPAPALPRTLQIKVCTLCYVLQLIFYAFIFGKLL